MRVAACLIAKDEGRYIIEWLSYHLAIGFDELCVYDNESSDDSVSLLADASKADCRIRYQFWPNVSGYSPQLSAYQDALRHISADWIAFIDTDEFIILKSASTIQEYLSIFPADVTAVSINWRNFASSHQSRPSRKLVLERFLYAPTKDFYRNEVVKSIVRPQHVQAMTAHVPYLKAGVHCRADGSPFPSPGANRAWPVLHHPAQINHYVIKSKEEYEAKRLRGDAVKPPDDSCRGERFGPEHWRIYDVNDEVDESAIPLVPAVKQISASLTSTRQELETRDGSESCTVEGQGNPEHGLTTNSVHGAGEQEQGRDLRLRVIVGHYQFVTTRLMFQVSQQKSRALDERDRVRKARQNEKQLQLQLDKLEKDRDKFIHQIQELDAEVETLNNRCAISESRLSEIRASTSWRATAPFRWSLSTIRKVARSTWIRLSQSLVRK